jgi:hypothetical protein
MNGEIDGAGKQRFFDLLGEQAFRPHLRQGDAGDFIASGFDDVNAAGIAQRGKLLFDPVRLPQR